jgi:ribulose-phosphate 3-epimerase
MCRKLTQCFNEEPHAISFAPRRPTLAFLSSASLTKPLFSIKIGGKKEGIFRPAVKIVPSVLAENMHDFLSLIRQAESFAKYVQIDLMDGIFVQTKSIPLSAVNSLETSLHFEVHLMFKDPLAAVAALDHPGLRKVIFHIESGDDHPEVVSRLRKRGIGVGLALNPETVIDEIGDLAADVDTLLFMTVDPGRYGSPFIPAVLDKVKRARKTFREKIIAVDGGVSANNLPLLMNTGVDYACIGSRIFLGGNPAENYRNFTERLKRLEETKE